MLLGATLTLASLLMLPAAVLADCPMMARLPSIEGVRGETFIGRVIREERLGSGDTLHVWDVERVFAGDIPSRLRYTSSPCFGTRYEVGERYLVSSSQLRGGDYAWTAAYRLLPGGRVELQRWWPPGYPRELRVRTLAAALAVVAPGAVPPTDSVEVTPVSGSGGSFLPPLAGLVGGLAAMVVLRRRSARQEPQAR
ncbi:MAG: hypothetical protein KF809_16605 [Chloroflexi bacterium]|nr:hypothetical protein [Chloroflexota bacterium]